MPDLLVSLPGTPFSLLLEVKDRYGKLTPVQETWIAHWQGKIYVVRTIKDIKEIVRCLMPIYVYVCTACEEKLEVKQKFSDAPLSVCPHCSGPLKKLPQIAGIIFNGSDFTKRTAKPVDTDNS